MLSLMRKRLIRLVIAVLALVCLTGCFRYRVESTIGADGLVSGSVVIGYDREFVKQQPGQGIYDDLSKFVRVNAASVSRGTASVQPMDAGQFRGFQINFSKVALSDFVQLMRHEKVGPGETGGVDYRLSRQGDVFVFDARVLSKDGQIPIPRDAFKKAELVVSLTFPGPVVSSNGTVSGRTVTWRPNVADLPRLTATGKAAPAEVAEPTAEGTRPVTNGESRPGGHGVRTALVAGSVGLLAAAAAGGWLALRRRP